MHLEQSGGLGCRPTDGQHIEDFRALCLGELRPPPAMTVLRAGCFEAGPGAALLYHFALVFRERAGHLHHHPPGGHGRVNGFGKRAKPAAAVIHSGTTVAFWRSVPFVLRGLERRKTGWVRAEAAGDPGPWRQQAIPGRGQ
jgi:hypothetical protein